jgi:hypothetical protein
MKINSLVLDALDEYHYRSLTMQKFLYDKTLDVSEDKLKEIVNDDLIFNVPIYDMLDRRYAAFSSFPEALKKKELDPKGHGLKYRHHTIEDKFEYLMCFYLFRLCGSGINYKPDSHGFGNFWICKDILEGRQSSKEWLETIPESKFSDNKGYLLPQFSIGLRNFIKNHSMNLVSEIYDYCLQSSRTIIDVVDFGNKWMLDNGFKRTTFVLSAFAADIAEYYPETVDQWSMIYAGTNAKKCIKAIFENTREHEAIEFLSKRYNAPPYSVEDSRLCDPVRYFLDYQSKYHIEKNNGNIYKNNSILKKIWNEQEYRDFTLQLQK